MRRRKVRRVAVRLARGRGGREPLPGARAAEKLARRDRKEQVRGLVKGLVLVGDLEADRAAVKVARRDPEERGLDLAGDMSLGRQVEEALVELVELVEGFPAVHSPLRSRLLRAERELALEAEAAAVEWAFPAWWRAWPAAAREDMGLEMVASRRARRRFTEFSAR